MIKMYHKRYGCLVLVFLALLLAPLTPASVAFASDTTVAQAGGILKLYSNIKGARILLNGEELGQTPTIRLLPPGTYKVRLELPGYEPYQEEIEIQPNKTITINAQLVKVVGSIEVLASVEGARVYLDDKEVGTSPNVLIEDLPAGTYTIQVRKTGYTTYTAPITVKPNVRLKLHVPMIANAATVVLTSKPEGAQVFLDNEAMGKTPLTLSTVPPGRHALKVVKEGMATSFRAFQVDMGQKLEVNVNLSSTPGGLRVKTRVPGADVYLEGSFLGKTPLQLDKQIQPGQYSLRITQEGYADHIQPVLIEPERSTRISAELVSMETVKETGNPSSPRSSVENAPLTRQWWFWTLVGGAVIAAGGTTAAVINANAQTAAVGDVLVTLP